MKVKSWYLGVIKFKNGAKLEISSGSEEMVIAKVKALWGDDLKPIKDFHIYEVVGQTNVMNKLKLS